MLLSGAIKFSYRKIGEAQKQDEILDKPCVIEISSMVTHKVEALTDIAMIECNSIRDIQMDRQREEV